MSNQSAFPNFYIIPVNLEALRISSQDLNAQGAPKFLGPTARFDNIGPNRKLGYDVDMDLAQSTSQITKGVHLHWSLPDAITRGQQTSEDTLQFPHAPNRWLVTRYFQPLQVSGSSAAPVNSNPPAVKQWLLESNRYTNNLERNSLLNTMVTPIPQLQNTGSGSSSSSLGTSGQPVLLPTIPPPAPGLSFEYLGAAFDYNAQWAEMEPGAPGEFDPELNAISYYGPSFAAYYQNSMSVFGFHDAFADMVNLNIDTANFSVSYQIIGWHSLGQQDDLLAVALAEAQEAYNQQGEKGSPMAFFLNWVKENYHLDFGETDGSSSSGGGVGTDDWPTDPTSVFHAQALNIQWVTNSNPGHQFLPSPTEVFADYSDLEIAIGNNTAEAMSALIARDNVINNNSSTSASSEPYPDDLEKNIEYLFNAFQQDLLRKLAGTDPSMSLDILDEYLHSYRFTPVQGGRVWSVQPKQDNSPSKPQAQQEEQLPLEAAELLNLLNTAQKQFDQASDHLSSLQRQVYLDWTQYGLYLESGSTNESNSGCTPLEWIGGQAADLAKPYITSGLLGIFAESGLTGIVQDSDQGPVFTPVWTALNTTAEKQINNLASAQAALLFLFDKVLNEAKADIQEAISALNSDNISLAIADLQAILDDQDLPKIITLLGPNQVKPQIDSIRSAVFDQINGLTVGNNAVEAVLNNVILNYQSSAWNGSQALENAMQGEFRTTLFNPDQSIDTQYLFLLLQAAHFEPLSPLVPGGKLLKAKTALDDLVQIVQKNVLPDLQMASNAIAQYFPGWLSQVQNLVANVRWAVEQLTTIGSSSSSASVEDTESSSSSGQPSVVDQVVQKLAASWLLADQLSNDSNRRPVALALQSTWQGLLQFLPSGHQLTILAGLMGGVAALLDAQNSLVRSPADPYYAPSDPVLLLTQPDELAPGKPSLLPVNRNGEADNLPCRQAGNLLDALSLSGAARPLSYANIKTYPNIPVAYPNLGIWQPVIQALLFEGYLLSPEAAGDLAGLAGNLPSGAYLDLMQIQINLANQLLADQEFLPSPPVIANPQVQSGSLSATYHGIAPYCISLNLLGDNNPFLPVFMAWSAVYTPLKMGDSANHQASVYPPNLIQANFALDEDHVDLEMEQSPSFNPSYNLSGQITLSTTATAGLLNQIRQYFKDVLGKDISKGEIKPEDLKNQFQLDLYEAYEYYRTKVILSQSMGGFHVRLQQQVEMLQLPLNNLDPADTLMTPLFNYLQQTWDNPLWQGACVGQHTATDYFLPVRAGQMQVTSILIVDVFGRYFQLGSQAVPVQQNITVAQSLKSAATGNNVYLAPRITQPSRMTFNWLSSQSEYGGETVFIERTSTPAFSPICGWLMPNHLDDSLVMYDASGDPLGSLGIEGFSRTQTWRSVPKSGVPGSSSSGGFNPADNGRQQMLADIADANPFIQDFLTKFAFPNSGAAYFQDFLKTLDRGQKSIHTAPTPQEQALALFIGKPLVLVRAIIQINTLGGQLVAQDACSFAEALVKFSNAGTSSSAGVGLQTWNDYDLSVRFQADYRDVGFPVQIGNLMQFDDGLVGFFLNDDWSVLYTPIPSGGGAIQQADFTTIQLRLAGGSQTDATQPSPSSSSGSGAGAIHSSAVVTMLMDPRAAIHATSGVLPVQELRLPDSIYTAAMNKLMVYFLTNSVLLSNQLIDIPVPNEAGYAWSWIQPGLPENIPLNTVAVEDRAVFGYSPQRILDGWLSLSKK